MSDYPMMNPYQPYAGTASSPSRRPHFTFVSAVKSYFKNYIKFDGRASRSEYWWIVLFNVLVSIAISILTGGTTMDTETGKMIQTTSYKIVSSLWNLATFLPALGLGIRRLHDIDKSGWWLLLSLIPIVGWIILLIWYLKDSDPAGARFDGPVQPAIVE